MARGKSERGWVSVWVGDLTDELDLDAYLGAPFANDHGFALSGQGEYAVRPEAVQLAELLARFWLADRWLGKVVEAARARGLETASCALVEQHYHHVESLPPRGPLRFVVSLCWAADG